MSNWHPDFGPCYTPMEMLDKGIFEGVYTHAIEDIPSKYKSHPNVLGDNGPDVNINEFKVKSRLSLKEWQEKGWTTKLSPLGWWEWYIKYFEGRRNEKEDKLQISRWNSFVSRYQSHISQKCDLEDVSCQPLPRQSLLQWGWDSTIEYTDDQVRENAQRMARLSNAILATEAYTPSPDLINLGVNLGSWLFKKGIEKINDGPKRSATPKSFKISRSRNPNAYLPYITVSESDGYVEVMGFTAFKFAAAMTDILKTTRFKNMFHKFYTRNFIIESFFVVELLRCIELLLVSGERRLSIDTLVTLREKLIANTWIGAVEKAEPKKFKWDNLKRLNISLLPKQKQFLEEYATLIPRLGLKGWLLAAAPGTGKTLTGIAWHLCQDFETTIYVVPNNTVEDVWEKTLYRFFDKVPSYYISRPNFKLTGNEEFVICHYEHLPKLIAELPKFRRRRMGLWLDESHNFNELSSQRTKMLIKMANDYIEESIFASGTPLKALGRELVPLFRIIDSLFTPKVEDKFVKTFGSSTGQVLELLEYRTNRASFKVSKHEVVQNEVSEHSIPVRVPDSNRYLLSTVRTEVSSYITERLGHYAKMNDEIIEKYFAYINEYAKQVTNHKEFDKYLSAAREMHRKFSPYAHGDQIKLCSAYERDYIIPWLKDTNRKDFKFWCSRYKYPLLVVRGEALGRILGRRRIECCIDMVPYAGLEDIVEKATKKTVIFTNHVEVLKAICEHLKLMGHAPIAVYGETNKDLSENLKRFMTDPKAKIIGATYKSLSTGVPLVEASSLVLFDSPFRNYVVEQAISRLDRLDQDSAIEIIRPFLDTDGLDNLSTRSIELAEWSKELVDSILKLDKIDERFLATEDFSEPHAALAYVDTPEATHTIDPLPNISEGTVARDVEWRLHDECNVVTDVNALAAYEKESVCYAIESGKLNSTLATESFFVPKSEHREKFGDARDKLAMILSRLPTDLYLASCTVLPQILNPQIPESEGGVNNVPSIPRISFSETIEGAVRVASLDVKQSADEELVCYVYMVNKGTSGSWVPGWALEDAKFVSDTSLTKMWWGLSEVTIECVGTVEVRAAGNREHLKYKPYGGCEKPPLDIIFEDEDLTGEFNLT